jgi:hypothetical protein
MTMRNSILWAMLFIAAGYAAAVLGAWLKSPNSCLDWVKAEELQTYIDRSAAYEAEKAVLLNILDQMADSLEKSKQEYDSLKKAPHTTNYADSTDESISAAFIARYGVSSSTQISVAREHLVNALNSLDSLERCRRLNNDAEEIIKEHEAQHEALLDYVDIQKEQVALLDTGLQKCANSNTFLEQENSKLKEDLKTQKKKTLRARLVAGASITLNVFQTWLLLIK